VKRSIGTHTLDYVDPFLLFDHFESGDPDAYRAGFPRHPHRGIETVTYMLAGEVKHADSMGNKGRIGTGGVQWMTAGGGLMHEEMPAPGSDGRMAGFQLWLNLPARLKMMQPRYQELAAAQIPESRRDDGTMVRVIAGDADGVEGPVRGIFAEPTYLDVALPPGAPFVQPVPNGHSAFAYVFQGEGFFGPVMDDGQREDAGGGLVPSPRMVLFGDGDEVRAQAGGRGVRFLLISGQRLGEPIARYGPFVMTRREELQQALRDLQEDTFVWRDDEAWARERQASREA
jgi:hypothetical protein